MKYVNFPLPQNDAELELLTNWYFGKSLHISRLDFSFYSEDSCYNNDRNNHIGSGSYEVMEDYNSYHGKGWKYSQCENEGYHDSGIFWNRVFGDLSCGGISRASYGQFYVDNYRHGKRLEKWIKSRNRKDNSYKVRPAFLRLALLVRWEERKQDYSR